MYKMVRPISQAHLWDAPSVPSLSVHVSDSSALLSMYKMVRPICLYIRWLGLCIFPCIRWLGLYPGPTSELPCLFPAYLSVLADFSPTPEQIICQRVFLTSQTAWSLCPGRRVFLLEPEPCCWPFIGLFSSIWKRVSWDALLRIGLKFQASENQAEKKEGGWIVMQRRKVGRPHRNILHQYLSHQW